MEVNDNPSTQPIFQKQQGEENPQTPESTLNEIAKPYLENAATNAEKVNVEQNKLTSKEKALAKYPHDFPGTPMEKALTPLQKRAISNNLSPKKEHLERAIDEMRLQHLKSETEKTSLTTSMKITFQPLLKKVTQNPVLKGQAFYIPAAAIRDELNRVQTELQSVNSKYSADKLSKKMDEMKQIGDVLAQSHVYFDKDEVLSQLRTKLDLSLSPITIGSEEDPNKKSTISESKSTTIPKPLNLVSKDDTDLLYEAIIKIKNQSSTHLSMSDLESLGISKYMNMKNMNPLVSSLEFTSKSGKPADKLLDQIIKNSVEMATPTYVLKTGAENLREILAGKVLSSLGLDFFVLTKHEIALAGTSHKGSEEMIGSRYLEGSTDFETDDREIAWTNFSDAKKNIALYEHQIENMSTETKNKISEIEKKIQNLEEEQNKSKAEIEKIEKNENEQINEEMKVYSKLQADLEECNNKMKEAEEAKIEAQQEVRSMMENDSTLVQLIVDIVENGDKLDEINEEIDSGEYEDAELEERNNNVDELKNTNEQLFKELESHNLEAKNQLNKYFENQKSYHKLYAESREIENKLKLYGAEGPKKKAIRNFVCKIEVIDDEIQYIQADLKKLNSAKLKLGGQKQIYVEAQKILNVGSGESVRAQALIDCLFCSADSHVQQYRVKENEIFNIDFSRFFPPSEAINSITGTMLAFNSYFFGHPQTQAPFSSEEITKILSWDVGKVETEWRDANLIGNKEDFDDALNSLREISKLLETTTDTVEKEKLGKQFWEIRKQCMSQIHPKAFEDFKNRLVALQDYIKGCEKNQVQPNLHDAFFQMYPLAAPFMKVYERIDPHFGQITFTKLKEIIEKARTENAATKEEILQMEESLQTYLNESGAADQFWLTSSQVLTPYET